MTDGSGAVQAHYEYDMWGQPTETVRTLSADFQYAGYLIHPAYLKRVPLGIYSAAIKILSNAKNFVNAGAALCNMYIAVIGLAILGQGRIATMRPIGLVATPDAHSKIEVLFE